MKAPPSIPLASLLELAAAQLEVAMQNTASQIDELAGSVAMFAQLGAQMCTHPDAAIAALGVRVAAQAQRAVVAMQFHDQLSQRLRHVRDALGDAHDALAAPAAPDPAALLAVIRARCTMEDERRLFDAMIGHLPGAPRPNADCASEALRGSVELF
jgi:hypothetical protein